MNARTNARDKTARILAALASINLICGALLHCLAAYPRVSPAVQASNLAAPFQGALRAVFLLVGWDWIVIAIFLLIVTFNETKLRKALVLFCGFALLVIWAIMLRFLGWFIGTDMILASGVLTLLAGLLFQATQGSHPAKTT